MKTFVFRPGFASAFIVLFLGLTLPRGHAHPVSFNSTITYSSSQPSGAPASVANWTGATFDAANIDGSGTNADGGTNNGTANDASTYVANNQPVQGQTFTTGSNANGYDVTGITVRMAGYTNNTATGSNTTFWNMNASNGPILATIGRISGTTASAVSTQCFMAGGTGNPGSGGSANGTGTYITFNLPYAVHLDPNTTYGFDLIIGNASSNYFEWLGTSTDAYSGGTAYTRSWNTITPLSGDRVFMVNMMPSAAAYAPFSHPGVLHTQTDLDRMKAKVDAGAEPWKSSSDILASSPYAQTSWSPAPVATIIRTGADPWLNNYSRTQEDAQAIYELSLRWKITGDTAYADRAVVIANAWSSTLQGINGDSNAALASGICGYLFAIGGEVLSTYPGWAAADEQAYKDMMMRVFYPANLNFLWWHYDTFWREGGNTHYRSNWDADAMAALAAIGILCDNRAVYQQALDFFKNGPGTGRVERIAWYIHPDGMAQTEESGRDQAHNLGAWCSMAMLCQMAWNQGDDLFGYDNNRVLRAFEYNAKYNLGNEVPWVYHRNTNITYTETLSSAVRGLGQYYTYELVYSHYTNVKGIDAPYSKLAMEAVRPEPRPNRGIHPSQLDWLGLGSLTYAQDAPTTSVAPGGLCATWSKNQVILTWWGSATATSYQVQRATSSGGPYTVLGTVTGPELNYTDTNVANGTDHYYKVTAVTPGGNLDSNPLLVNQALVTRYTFDNTTNDSVGTRYAIAMGGTSAPGYTTGFSGQAISLNGTDQYLQLPVGSGNYRDITLSAWVYWNGGSAWQRVFDFGTEIEKYMMLTVNEGSGKLLFQMTTSRGTDGTLTLTGPTMPTGAWTHIAVTFNGDTATMYVNGKPVAAGASTGKISPMFGQPFCYLGRSMFNGDPYFNGRIDDFRIYNHALSGDEVYSLWGQGGANNAPVFSSDPLTRANATEDVNYSSAAQTLAGAATDANGGALTYSKVSGPAWLNIAGNGALSGTPTNSDVGKNLFVVRVTDPSGATDDANFYITVDNTNDPPVWTSNPLTKPAVSQGVAYSETLAGSVTDDDAGATITFSKVSGPAWLSVAPDGSLTGTPSAADAGVNSFVVRATDDSSASTDATLNITVFANSLQALYALDGSAANGQGGAAATISGAATYVAGVMGQALTFDGSTNYVTLGSLSPYVYEDITVAAWVWWDGGGTWQRIFDFGSGTDDYLFLTPSNGSNMRFGIKENGIQQNLDTTILPTGTWVHVAVTLGGNTATIYINGVAQATSSSITNDPSDINLTQNFIGNSQWSADPLFAGKIDDFRIYNYALSAAEIAALLNGVAAITPSGLNAVPSSSNVTLTWNTSATAQTYNVKRATISGGPYTPIATGLTATSYQDTTVVSGNMYYYVVSAVNGQGESADSTETAAAVSDLLVRLKFDESSGTTAADSSGNGYDGALVNSPTWTAGYLRNAVNLAATANEHVTLPTGIVSSLADYTISAWVKVSAFSTWARLFDFGTGTTNYMFLSTQYTGTSPNNAKMRFAIRTPSVSEQQISSSTALPVNSWAHVAVTRSGNLGSLYLNGSLVGTNNSMTLSPSSLGSTTQNYLGRSQFSADPYFNGAIDDFRIYSRALSAGELDALAHPAAEAPDSLTATPGDGKTTLTWSVANAATSYNVKRATVSGGPYTTIAPGVPATTYTDTSVTNGTTYFYVVTGSNALPSESTNSAEAVVTPYPTNFHPYASDSSTLILYQFDESAGGSVAANGGTLGGNAYSVNLTTAVSTPPVVTNVIGGATGYAGFGSAANTNTSGYVIGSDGNNNGAYNADVSGGSLSADAKLLSTLNVGNGGQTPWTIEAMVYCTLGTLNANQEIICTDSSAASRGFQFRINSAGELELNFINGTSSGTADIKTAIPTSGAHAYAANTWFHVAAAYDGTNVRLYWTKVDSSFTSANLISTTAVGVGVAVGAISGPLCIGNENRNVAGEYFQGSIDEVRISSVARGAGEFYWLPPPSVPTGLAAIGGDGQVSLSWASSAGAAGYYVKRATTSGGPYTLIATSTNASYNDASVANGAPYYYVVSAVNGGGESPNSAQVNALPLSAIQSWRQTFFGTPNNIGNAADDADPDFDGRNNKLEYATGTNPIAPDAGPPATLGTTPDGARLTLIFQRVADPALTYEVLACDDLSGWNVIWSSTGSQNEVGEVEVTDAELISAHAKRFLRMRVSP